MSEINGYLTRDPKKTGGEIKFWLHKPSKLYNGSYLGRDMYGKKDPRHEMPMFSMTKESFEETYEGKAPSLGSCVEERLEI